MNDVDKFIHTLCEEYNIFKMLKNNIKQLDSFEFNTLEYLNNIIKEKRKLLGINKKDLEQMYKNYLFNKFNYNRK